ncbi:reverse transcriptase-rnase h-integrase [Moniliophthora roreri MCA 2997]|uniref:Reverse transcriptase-rnase h-integrase n=1 Tax=Moniliophthora roreri (strain MCA 2997) TaxID=1381753 RepID=V2WQY5_MONRO|nr:reverse transcriptase-rnase h-integrase [Moniliophthora roreri MCA 2997]
MLDVSKPFIIEADASKWATGAVLKQKGTDREWHPCGYLSKSLSPMERNYEIYDRELLTIYRALMEWRHYLMGGKFKVVVLSDHKNLTYFRTAQKLNRRQARWSLFLSEFDLGLVHVPGKAMTQADALSWRSNEQDDIDTDNEDIIVLPERLFIKGIDLGMKKDIEERLGPDDFHKSALEQLLHQGVPPIKSALSDWKIEGELLFFQDRVYVPNDADLRRRIVQSIHETPGVGHPGQWNTVEQVQRDFRWPGMAKFIRSFVDGCLLHLFNTGQYDDQIRNATDQHNRLEPCVKSMFFLRSQRKLFERIVESCSLEIANQVMYACNYQLGLEGPITIPERCLNTLIPSPSVSSTISEDEPTGMDTPVPTSTTLPSSATRTSPEFPDTLVYPDPTPTPDIKPKVESIDSLARSQSEPPVTDNPGNLQTPEASVPPECGTPPEEYIWF